MRPLCLIRECKPSPQTVLTKQVGEDIEEGDKCRKSCPLDSFVLASYYYMLVRVKE
jgi:hypothetical protein